MSSEPETAPPISRRTLEAALDLRLDGTGSIFGTLSEEELLRRLEHLEAELRSLRAFQVAPYRAVVEDMTELVVRWRPDGTRVFVNDAYCRLFQTPREKLLGTSFWPLITEEDRNQVRERIARLTPEAPVSIGRHRAVRPNGEIVWMEWSDRALYDSKWNVVEYQSVGRDISERVRNQEQLRRIEHADAVTRTSAAIAHDLAGVLGVIALRTTLTMENETNPGQKVTPAAVEQGLRLLNQLKQLAYGLALKPVCVDVNKRIVDALSLLGELVGNQVRIETQLSGEPCVILGDPTQLDQILLNLVRNAAEAMNGTGVVSLITEVVPVTALAPSHHWSAKVPERCVVLRVTDNGPGIEPAILPRIFDSYMTTKRGGQGLGLATVKAIAEANSGSIRVETSKSGTVFELAFPVAGNQ